MFSLKKHGRVALSIASVVACIAPTTVASVASAASAASTGVEATQIVSSAPILSSADVGCSAVPTDSNASSSATVSGTVKKADNSAVQGAMVIAMRWTQTGPSFSCVQTNASGAYSGLGINGTTLVIVAPPSGTASAALASKSKTVTPGDQTTITENFVLGTANLAVPLGFKLDGSTLTRVNAPLVFACLTDNSATSGPGMLTCGVSRDHSGSTVNPVFDARLDTTSIPSDKRANASLYVFGGLATATAGETVSVEGGYWVENLPTGKTQLDLVEETWPTTKTTAQQQLVELYQTNAPPPNTNCNETEGLASTTPFINGTVTTPSGDPAAYYQVELKAFWRSAADPTSVGWFPNFGYGGGSGRGGSFYISTDKNGSFSLCALAPDPENSGGSTGGFVASDAIAAFIAILKPNAAAGVRSVATTVLIKWDASSSTTYKDCITSGTPACSVSFQAKAPQIEGTVKTPGGAAVPYAQIEVFRNGGTEQYPMFSDYTRFFSMQTAEDGWFGFASNIAATQTYQVKASSPGCGDTSCPYKNLAPVTANFQTGATMKWVGQDATSKNLALLDSNFVGFLKDSDGNALSAEMMLSCSQSGGTGGSTQGMALGGTETSVSPTSSTLVSPTSSTPAGGGSSGNTGGGSSCSMISTYTDYSTGAFATYLPDGTYSLQLYGDSDIIDTRYSVVVSTGAVTQVSRTSPGTADLCGGSASACGASIEIRTAAPNFAVMVQSDLGVPVEDAYLNIEQYSACPPSGSQGTNYCWPFSWAASRPTGSDNREWSKGTPGVAAFSLTAGKIYRININPPYDGSTDVTATELFIKVVDDNNGGVNVYRCAKWMNDPMNSSSQPCDVGYSNATPGAPDADDLMPTITSASVTRYLVTMASSNFKGNLCRPGTGTCVAVANSWVGLSKWTSGMNGGGWWNYQSGAPTSKTGAFSFAFTTTGAYKLELNQPWVCENNKGICAPDTELTRTEVRIYVEVAGDNTITVSRASTDGSKIADSVISPVAGRYDVRYASPSIRGLLVDPTDAESNLGAADTNIEVLTEQNTSWCTGCRQWYGNARTDGQGRFALDLEAGKYILRAQPSWNSSGLTAREIKVRMQDCDSSDPLPEAYAYDADDCAAATPPTPLALNADGRLVITLSSANFAGVLLNPVTEAPVPWSSYNIEKWNTSNSNGPGSTGYWEWQNLWGNTNQNGAFGINLETAGRYRVTMRAPWNLTDFSDAQVILDVAASGSDMIATPDVEASGGSDVISADSDGRWEVSLRLPNASGFVTDPTGATKIEGAWINIQKWYAAGAGYCPQQQGCWNWQNEINGTSTRYSSDNEVKGSFAMNLPAGHWRLQVNPPWNSTGYTMKEIDVLVDGAGTLCYASSSDTTCVGRTAIVRGEFEIALGSPNFTGYVVTDTYVGVGEGANPASDGSFTGSVSRWSQVRFESWTTSYGNSYWGWANIWLNTNQNGLFSSNITSNGAYKVTFEPNWELNSFSAVTRYLAVCDSGAKIGWVTEAKAKAWTCSDANKATLETSIAESIVLNGANIKGIVKDGTNGNAPLGNVWISVLTCEASPWGGEWCNWVRGTNTPSAGTAAGKFGFRIDNEYADPVKYKFEVNPPWNSTAGLVRQQINVWVGEFDRDITTAEYCLTDPIKNGLVYDCGSGNTDWHGPNDTWEIVLTAGNLAGKVVTPDADCTVVDTCLGMANAWLQVEKWEAFPWDSSSYGWMWKPIWANSTGNWEAADKNSGNFGLNIDAPGIYRVNVNPSWNNPDAFTKATYLVNVDAAGDWCIKTGVSTNSLDNKVANPLDGASSRPSNCTINLGDRDNETDLVTGFTARLTGSNLTGVLYDSTADLGSPDPAKRVGFSWMSLQKEVTYRWCWGDADGVDNVAGNADDECYSWTWWQWVGSSNTAGGTSAGKFGFSVTEPGSYRMEFYPSWGNANAQTQFHLDFDVNSGGGCENGNSDPSLCTVTLGAPAVAGTGPGNYLVKYPAPNFAGTLFDKTYSASADNSTKKVGGAWIAVMRADNWQWVGGTSTIWGGDDEGDFSMLLDANQTYRVEIYPPWSEPEAGLRRTMFVRVDANGDVDQIVLGQDQSSTNYLCGGDATACTAPFDVTLLGENINGFVYYPKVVNGTPTPTVMPWAWANAFKCDGATWSDTNGAVDPGNCWTWAGWANSQYDGSIRFGLETDGIYRISIWPNYGLYSAGSLEVEVHIVGGVMEAWRYRGGQTSDVDQATFAPDFGFKKPNVNVTIAGPSEARFVQVSRCADGSTTSSCLTPTILQRLESVYDAGAWRVAINLEPGFYRFSVVRKLTDGTTTPTAIVEVTASHTGDAPLAVALDIS